MNTDDLIGLLAQNAGAAPHRPVERRIAWALGFGLPAALAIAALVPGFVPAETFHHPGPWFKLIYAAALAVAAIGLVGRLARPGATDRAARRAVTGVVAAAALAGVVGWLATPPAQRLGGLLGHSWWECPGLVLLHALPALAALLWAVRGLAPTRPRAAGLAAGLLAGALGAGAYALACTELAVSFVAVWYTAGIALAAGLGAVLGPRVLRW